MFDPYRKWLGIQPKDQPPNYYQLLGVELFEDDPDVIEGAADRQMTFIRQYQSGEHAAAAARLLNELAVGRLCLLKKSTKSAYDAKLRQEMAAAKPVDDADFADLEFSDDDLNALRSPNRRKKVAGKSQARRAQQQLMIGGGAAICLLLVVFLLSGRRAPRLPAPPDSDSAASSHSVTPAGGPDKPPSHSVTTPGPLKKYAWTPTVLVTGAAGAPIDLLKQVDLKRDVDTGKWEQTSNALIGDRRSRIYLPAQLPDDYQLKFNVRRVEGNDTLKIGFMMGGRQGMLALDGWGSTHSGLYVDGREPNSNCTTFRGNLFRGQSASTIVMTVHPRHFHAAFDGKTIVDLFGAPERLDLHQHAVMPSRESAFLEAVDGKYVIESASLAPIKPEPEVARPARLDREIEILPLVDLDTDMQSGVWSVRKETLYSPESNGKLYLPTVVPEEYTLSATVELNAEHRGIFAFIVGLVADRTNFEFVAADGDTGLDLVDGQRWWFNCTRLRGPVLKAGVRAKLACTVTKGGIRIDVDDRTIIDYRGDVRRLSLAGDLALKDTRRLFLSASHHCKIRDLTLGPPTGPLAYSRHAPIAAGKSADLLKVIEPVRDAFSGAWELDGPALRCVGDVNSAKLVIPYDVPGDFKLTMLVTRVEGGKDNNECLFVGFPYDQARAMVAIDGHGSKMTGLYLDGAGIEQNPATHRAGPVIPAGPCTIALSVRNHRLQLSVNDAIVLDWSGNSQRCSQPSEYVSLGRWLALGSYQQGFRFEKLDLELFEPAPERLAPKLGPDGKLLRILNLDRDVRRGEWKLDTEGLTCPASLGCRLRIPAPTPPRYVFSAQVERKQGDSDLFIGLLAGSIPFAISIDGDHGHQAGIDTLDGFRFNTRLNVTHRKYASPLLPLNQSVMVRCVVLPDTIVVTCGDKEVIRWHGDPRRLGLVPEFHPANRDEEDRTRLWLSAWGSQFLYRDLELKPLSENEAAEISKGFTGVYPLVPQIDVPLAAVERGPTSATVSAPVGTAVVPNRSDKSWLVNRHPESPALILINGLQLTERDAAMEACRYARMPFDLMDDFPAPGFDYKKYSLIVVGTNVMNYWGSPERKDPAAFQSLETFVRGGGHLLVFNTYNGANMHHLEQFGIKTGFSHSNSFRIVPGVTEIVFDGARSLIPADPYLKQAGNFNVETPHKVILQRGQGSFEGGPAVATVKHGAGRVTYSSVEPSFGFPRGFWVVQGLIRWAARGAPVTRSELTEAGPLDKKPKVATPRKLEFLEARYGTDEKWDDVRPLLSAVKSGILIVTADASLVGGKFVEGKPKQLQVHYRLDGIEESQKIDEYGMLCLDLRPAPAAPASRDFKLLEARWGVGVYQPTTWVDVTRQVRMFVKENRLMMGRGELDQVLTSGPDVAKDPDPTQWKSLVIHYQFQGRDSYAVFPRGMGILIGDPPAGVE